LLALVSVVVGCGGGQSGPPASSQPTGAAAAGALPVGWKRCTSTRYGFSVGYPESWHVASYRRLDVLGAGAAYRKRFFQRMVCLNYDPRPFTVRYGTEGPQTALAVSRVATARAFRREVQGRFDPEYVRTIERRALAVGGHPATRFYVYRRAGAVLWEKSWVYGYLIDFGSKGGIVIESWRFGFRPVSWQRYHTYKAVADRMAPTVRVTQAAR
jgi:hypothetical protein